MSSGYINKTSMFRNPTNISFAGSIASNKTKSTTGRGEHDIAESIQSGHKIDPRFMIIQREEPPPSPKASAPIDAKVESWLNRNEKTQIDFTKTTASAPAMDREKQIQTTKPTTVQPTRKAFFQNLKLLHSVKSASRSNKPRSISASRATVSNHEVSSTNEESPRRRNLTLREKLNKLQTPVSSSNCQTIDIHHDETSANDSHDCCFKRKCESKTKLEYNVNVVNLCCTNQKVIFTKPKKTPDPVSTDEEEFDELEKLPKRSIDVLDRSRLIEEHKNLIRMKEEIENYYMSGGPPDIKPIYKLLFPIIIFIIVSLALFSIYYEIGVFTRLYNSIDSWIRASALVAMQRTRPPTKWELWSKFVKKCVEKMSNIGRKF